MIRRLLLRSPLARHGRYLSTTSTTTAKPVGSDDMAANSDVLPTSATTSDPPKIQSWQEQLWHMWLESSGTREIAKLKDQVSKASLDYDEATRAVAASRATVDRAIGQHDEACRQHAALMRNREHWTPEDAMRFAELVQKEVDTRRFLELSRKNLQEEESSLARAQYTYVNSLRQRYQEEQVWQEQWRILSTYGTWSLIVLNSLVFLLSQYFLRRREQERHELIAALLHEKIPQPLTIASQPSMPNTDAVESTLFEVTSALETSSSSAEIGTNTADDGTPAEKEDDSGNATEVAQQQQQEAPPNQDMLTNPVLHKIRKRIPPKLLAAMDSKWHSFESSLSKLDAPSAAVGAAVASFAYAAIYVIASNNRR